jgi:hypothetical protein
MTNHDNIPGKRNPSTDTSASTLIDKMCLVLEDMGLAYERNKALVDLKYNGEQLFVDIFIPEIETAVFCKEQSYFYQTGRSLMVTDLINLLKTDYIENLMLWDIFHIMYAEDPKETFDRYLENWRTKKRTPYFKKAKRQWNLHALNLELTNLFPNKPPRRNKWGKT